MDTMMGVKQALDDDVVKELGIINDSAPQYSIWVKAKILMSALYRSKPCPIIIIVAIIFYNTLSLEYYYL